MGNYKFGKRSLENIEQLHPLLQEILHKALETSPHDFGIHCGYRSVETQYEYYQQGRTKPGNVITWIDGITKRGYHNYSPSLAFDFHCSVKGNMWDAERKEVDGDPAYLVEIAEHILEVAFQEFGIELVWGGQWNNKDYPHIQLPQIFKKHAEIEKLY